MKLDTYQFFLQIYRKNIVLFFQKKKRIFEKILKDQIL